MGTHPLLMQIRMLARRVAFAADTRRKEALVEARQDLLGLVTGLDPDRILRESAEYRHGGFDALASVLSALEEQTLSTSTLALLAKSGRARLLNAVLAYPGRNQKQLAEYLEIKESNLANYLQELVEDGLLEPAPAEGTRGRSYALTPWGHKAWRAVVQDPGGYRISTKELEEALRASQPFLESISQGGLVSKGEFYRLMEKALEAESSQPIYLSTLAPVPLAASDSASATFHHKALKLVTQLRRPLHWVVAEEEAMKGFVEQLLERANPQGAPVNVYLVPRQPAHVPTRQVLDNAGLMYPAVDDMAQITDRDSSLQVWNRLSLHGFKRSTGALAPV